MIGLGLRVGGVRGLEFDPSDLLLIKTDPIQTECLRTMCQISTYLHESKKRRLPSQISQRSDVVMEVCFAKMERTTACNDQHSIRGL